MLFWEQNVSSQGQKGDSTLLSYQFSIVAVMNDNKLGGLKQSNFVIGPQTRSLHMFYGAKLKVSGGLVPFRRLLRENPFLGLFQFPAHKPWLVSFLQIQSLQRCHSLNVLLQEQLTLSLIILPSYHLWEMFSISKDPCDQIAFMWIIQDNVPISRSTVKSMCNPNSPSCIKQHSSIRIWIFGGGHYST